MIRAHFSHCLQSSLLSMVHLDGYVQRILKTQKIIDYLAKHKRLSTKLLTIWQIIDYLSKKIDYRLRVDIIDTPGHPAEAGGGSVQIMIHRDRAVIETPRHMYMPAAVPHS